MVVSLTCYNDNYGDNRKGHFINSAVSWNSQGFMSVLLVVLRARLGSEREPRPAPEQEASLWHFNLIFVDSDTHTLLFVTLPALGSLGQNMVLVFLCLGLLCQLLFFYFNLRF